MRGRGLGLVAVLIAGYLFLYGPIASLVIYSFNASRLVTVWAGFSTRWYGELWNNEQLKGAALLSLVIAALAASLATVIGTFAALTLVRLRRFPGRTLLGGLVTAPLVMPEVITGLSMLLLFVAMEALIGWPDGRGVATIVIAHVTFTLSFVTVIVRARLTDFDRSFEEAALDLGAKPLVAFVQVTLPLIAPALAAGWLLAFSLSLDDLVITSFVSGPSSTTLPLVVFSSVRLGVSPQVNALATIVIAVVAIAVAIASWLTLRRGRRT